MKTYRLGLSLLLVLLSTSSALAQMTNWLPGRVIVKLVPDYLRPRMYALNQASGTNSGTLLSLNATNGATISEIALPIRPNDMAITPACDALYVINGGSRTISKIDLNTFSVVADKPITTPGTYDPNNPIYLAVGRSNMLYFTDGGWAPSVTTFDYVGGTNMANYNDGNGVGGLVVTRTGTNLFTWRQYGWGAGNVNSWVTRYDATAPALTALETSFVSWRRDPTDTPIFVDAPARWVFNKQQMFAATNVSVLLTSFTENIYAISFDGTLAFGPTMVFNTQNGIALTNFSISTTVQAMSGDQKRLFRYRTSTSDLFVYDMSAIAPVSGPDLVPTPTDGAIVGLPPTNLLWTVSPIALEYDVYFGTNRTAVGTAGPSSAEYLGRVSTPGQTLPQAPTAGATYYWRVDVVGFSVTNAGPVWSFTVSSLAVAPTQLSIGAIAGYSPAPVSLSLTSAVPTAWTATVAGSDWVRLDSASGTSPSTITVSFKTTALAAGTYTNRIDITANGQTVAVPVTLDVKPLNILKMVTDYQRPYIYALQAPALSGQNGQLLFINSQSGSIEKTLPIGINPVDLTVHYGEGRLYIASWTENATYVVDLATQTLLPPLHIGTDIYKINAGRPGRIIVEGEDQWVGLALVDTTSSTSVASGMVREGDGEADPSGTVYYHCDNNISDANVHKYMLTNDTFVEVAGSLQHPYGSRNLILAPDGTRLFWRGYVYDANLNEQGSLGEDIYAATAHGDLALGSAHVFNSRNGQTLYTWPFSTSVLALSGDEKLVFLFNTTSKQLVTIPMSSIANVPGPGLNPTPADGAVINLPLGQLAWTASPFALSYRVFLGTNRADVALADTTSALYLGPASTTSFAMTNTPLAAGVTYYWRVDSVGFGSVTPGTVWAFTTWSVSISPQNLSLKGVVGLPILAQTISLGAPGPAPWTLQVQQPWIVATPTNGITPGSVTLSFNTAGLAAGIYTNQLVFTANGITLNLPVTVQLFNLSASKIAVDRNRNYIYVLHPGSGSFDDAFLLFLNTDTGVVEKVIPIGTNPTDLSVHPREDRLYVSNWQHNQTRVVDLVSRTELPSLTLGTDVYKINAGLTGRIVVEGEDQWVYMSLINDTTGATIANGFVREGDGEFDPSGRYYYHCENNISGAGISKNDVGNGSFVSVAGAGGHYYYGSRNIVLSQDGSRLFWTSAVYDANLADLGVIGAEIYACSTNGSVAFSATQAFDTATHQVIYNLPANTSVMAVDRLDQRLWYFNGAAGRIDSLAMSVIRAPTITQQPAANTSVGINGNVYLSVTAMGLAPFSYQWTLAGTNVPSATNYFLSMNGIQPAQQGDYQVLVSNPFGVVTSALAHVTVLVPPAITSQPQSTNVLAGQAISLSVSASGTAPLTYNWRFENSTISGATSSTLTIPNAQAINEGVYRAVVANSTGSATSSVALVRVVPSAPVVLAAPASLSVGASSNASFSVVATGTQPLAYQWLFNGTPIAGATATLLSLSNVQAPNAGSYQVAVTNGVGSISSAVATLTVVPVVPYFVTQPVGAVRPAATNLTLTALARGSEPIGYQWQRNGTNLGGATQTSLVLSNLSLSDSGAYWVLASNSAGMSTSVVATVVVTAAPPVFVEQPASAAVLAGSSTTLNSRATGSLPLGYQWYFQTSPLADQTNRQLSLNPVALSSAGQYYVVASNIFAAATSVVATVTVTTAPPVFAVQPASVTVVAGTSTMLSARVNGATPLSYQWYLQGNPLANKTNAQLTINPVTVDSGGPYFLVASNLFGVATSAVAQVTVTVAPAFVQGLSNVVTDVGRTLTFNVFAAGSGSLAYSWQFNGVALPGTNTSLSLSNIQPSQAGYYRVTASSQYGTISSTSRVSVLGPPSRVIAWGDNSGNQTNVPAGLDDAVAVGGGDYHSLALRHNGALVAWGYNGDGQTTAATNSLRFVSIAAGAAHNLAITEAGSIVAWGRNDAGQCTVPSTATSVLAVAAGDSHSVALLSSGTVVAWGDNSFSQVSGASQLTGVRAVAAGRNHNLALRSNGTVVGWGFNAYGQATPPFAITNAMGIAAGYLHSAALLSNGTVVVWGDNSYGQANIPAGLSNVVALAAGDFHTYALLANGSVVAWGNDWYGQTDVPVTLSNAIAVASGNYHGLSLVPVPPQARMENCRSVAGRITFDIRGQPGQQVLVQAATNLKHWLTLQTYTLGDAPVTFTDVQGSLYQRRFYRLVTAEGLPKN